MNRTLEDVERDVRNPDGRPEVIVTGRHLRDITEEALEAIKAHELYVRSEFLVRVSGGTAERLNAASLKGILERAANFVKETVRDGVTVTAPTRVPSDVPPDILSLPKDDVPFPYLRDIATTPVLLPSGQLLMSDGYDRESGILLRLDGLNKLRHDMSLDEARGLLDELLGDFPFVEDAGRAYAYAMLLQPVLRHAIAGPTPLYLVDAPLRGTGKGLLVDVACIVSTGRTAGVMPRLGDEELEKRITTLLIDGETHLLLDNVNGLYSTVLAAALTSERWRGRILGKSEIVHVDNHALWIASGNNVELSDEIARRTMPIRLDAGVERPEERRGFSHPQLKEWTRRNRGKLLSAVLSLVRAWVDSGRPLANDTIGSFENWSRVMGGVLGVAGVPGLLGGREALHAHAEAETTEWTMFLEEWHAEYGGQPKAAGELFKVLRTKSLLLDLWTGRDHDSALKRVGHALKGRRDRIYGRLRIRMAGRNSSSKSLEYRLEKVELTGGPDKTPENPVIPEAAARTVTSHRGFAAAETRNPRNPVSETENPVRESVVQHGTNGELQGLSGVSGVSKPAPPKVEAPAEVKRLYYLWKAGTYNQRPERQELDTIFTDGKWSTPSEKARLVELAGALLQVAP